ncbi:phosphoenolpyruvate synthase [bacterium BMS3Abin09]|nr:phosphoenolpyruvate synthase [bacterium BMS3Abin09]GBE40661.1 phosphoenolpyruvate synthase [bacterium BMS3Bbin09]
MLRMLARIFEKPLDIKRAFPLFKQILESNNRALEVIADMGETMGGDYLFDINYIDNAYSMLSRHLTTSMQDFGSLTKNRYQLEDKFDRIDSLINSVLLGSDIGNRELVLTYDRITWTMAREVGGKNYHLSELVNNLDLNIPAAFAITAHSCTEFFRHNRLQERISSLGGNDISPEELADVREAILKGDIPRDLDSAIESAIMKLDEINAAALTLAVRSSAEDEDGEFTFAGQFQSVLNVRPRKDDVERAYKEVLSSLFADDSVVYQRQLGYAIGSLRMPVACVSMVDAVSSGVLYTESPDMARKGTMMISASWGLGISVVQGHTEADLFIVKKAAVPELVESKVGGKAVMTVTKENGGVEEIHTPADLCNKLCITEKEIMELSLCAMTIEKYYKRPQDIEWAYGKDGKLYILQSRPLVIQEENTSDEDITDVEEIQNPAIIKNAGFVVQKGTASGKVFLLKNPSELELVPRGAILVAKNDSPQYIKAMPRAAAIITDTGTPASHMASICREFRIPTLVNTGNATNILHHGQEITLYAADEGNSTVYDGRVGVLIDRGRKQQRRMEELYEFRKKKYIMGYISALNLVDPLVDEFTTDKCKTVHDILRFMHEESVQALIEASLHAGRRSALKRLEISIPAGIWIIDMGGGLTAGAGDIVTAEDVLSEPFKALIQGMSYPGAWHTEAVPLKMGDLLSSISRMPGLTSDEAGIGGKNIAVISGEYVNLSLKFGYHYNLLDCYLNENPKNNHIYFRFVGGATDIGKRSRRIRLLDIVLKEYGLDTQIKGDLIIGRISNIATEETIKILDHAGRLIAYSRQLDTVLVNDSLVEKYAQRFLAGNYKI